nr:monovalent cation/H(+) antiporter subunit G [Salinarchaeum laminariae]
MNEFRAIAIVACVLIGLFFTLVSTVGVLRLPDIYTRAHTASQADTLGAGFALAGVALAIGTDATAVKAVLLLFFMFVTNPTAAHAIARAAHEDGIVPWATEDGAEGAHSGAGAEDSGTVPADSGGDVQ